ncbi:hypothetical protein [Paenibacillus polymyxa]|uniref:Uncharacterized protein n=1 Tax=Paenibacillus polymyxa (strain SC2) TaxID=886882 RepID=E3ELD2_PAEPS|nr:hypothetical protein [Paenibacillus polymyxa]ADO59963.1 hypothetical protein PPSC2_28360 [Paenibacillus polymyxa SC2]WPQ59817.1 hypothetical protein SKN87_26370 [Paenibacillus polymyxa]
MQFEYTKNIADFEKKVVVHHRKEWYSALKNVSELHSYVGAPLSNIIKGRPTFVWIITYVSELFEAAYDYGSEHLPPEAVDEVIHYEQEGKLCVYLSVLTYALISYNQIADGKEMKYVQGYYRHKADAVDWISGLLGNEHLGNHAWITIGKAVIDISIKQEERFFRFNCYPVILGEVPPGMTFKGFPELKKTVNKYVEQMAKRRNLSVPDWISQHNTHMVELSKKKTL